MIRRLAIPVTIEDNPSVRILEWHAAVGDPVAAGTLLVELETHKALIEVRAGQPGILRRRHGEEGDWLPLGETLALFSDTPEEPLDGEAAEWAAEFLIG